MATQGQVTPNRRGARSREVVLNAAERLMAEHGYEAATTSAIVKAAGIPISSVYHYFGSKNGILLAVMERGAQRFFAALDLPTERVGTSEEHLHLAGAAVQKALQEHPSFLRLLLVLSMQPAVHDEHDTRKVVRQVRDQALAGLRAQFALALGADPDGDAAATLARFALAMFDGAFVAGQADDPDALSQVLDHLPTAILTLSATFDS